MKLPSFLAVAYVVGASAGAQPTGYHIGAAIVLPDSLVEVLARGRFRASVLRVAGNANDARLIAMAEQLYPTPDAVIASATTADERSRLVATAAGVSLNTLKVPHVRPEVRRIDGGSMPSTRLGSRLLSQLVLLTTISADCTTTPRDAARLGSARPTEQTTVLSLTRRG